MTFLYECRVLPEWVDFNQHMRDAFYGLVFSLSVDGLMDEIGLDEKYRAETKGTIYVVEDHKFYLREVKEGASLLVKSQVIACDEKRIHLWQSIESGGVLAAVCESMQMHVSQEGAPHVAPMPAAVLAKVQAAQLSAEEVAALPKRAGEIGMRRKK